MATQEATNSAGNSRRSTRSVRASDKAVENIVLDAAATSKPKKRKEKAPPAKVPAAKKGKKQGTSTADNTALIPAEEVTNSAGADQTQSKSSDNNMQKLVEEACARLIPSIVTNVLQNTRQLESQTEELDTPSASDQDGSESEDEVEEDLWATALTSRRQQAAVTLMPHVPSQPADLLPALDAKVIRKIKKGEFVDLSLCLPSFSPQAKAPLVSAAVNSNGDPAWRLESSIARGKIRDFSDWMVAWNSRCASFFYPVMSRQFLFYQSEITNLFRFNTFSSVLAYDQAFRTRISSKEVLRWDYHDNELRSALLIPLAVKANSSRPEVHCWSCKQAGHVTTNCPWRSGTAAREYGDDPDSSPPFRAPQQPAPPPTNASSNQTTRSAAIPPQRTGARDVCHFWNSLRGCSFKNCRFEHRCEKCRSRQHTLVFCPQRHEH